MNEQEKEDKNDATHRWRLCFCRKLVQKMVHPARIAWLHAPKKFRIFVII